MLLVRAERVRERPGGGPAYLPGGTRCGGSSVREQGASSAGWFLAERTWYHGDEGRAEPGTRGVGPEVLAREGNRTEEREHPEVPLMWGLFVLLGKSFHYLTERRNT